jgi:hypothetical protein
MEHNAAANGGHIDQTCHGQNLNEKNERRHAVR